MIEDVYVFPTSFAQQRLWFLDQLEPDNPAYNIPSAIHLKGILDADSLDYSINEIIKRHEILRTTFGFVDGEPVQILLPHLHLEIPVTDLSNIENDQQQRETESITIKEARQCFDLVKGPLLRARLLRLAEEEHILLFTMHHIISDGWSLNVLVKELTALYEARINGKPSPLEELPVQYADFAQWQRTWFQGESLETHLSYWRQQLGGELPVLDLPVDRPRPQVKTFRGAKQSVLLPESLCSEIKSICADHTATLFMTLLSAFKLLLYRYTGQNDILVGTPIAGRNRSEIEGLIGFFLNTLVLRTSLEGDPTFRELLERVRTATLDAFAHQDLPFEKLLEELHPERDLSRTPLFQVFFNVLNFGETKFDLPGLSVEILSIPTDESKFDMTLYVAEKGKRIELICVYNADIFAGDRMAEMLEQFQHLLRQVVGEPGNRISTFSLVTDSSKAALPDPARSLSAHYEGSVHEIFSRQARISPRSVAVEGGDEKWSYAELDRLSNRLANCLIERGVKPQEIIAVYGHRSASLVWSLMGIFKAGASFLIMDPAYPTPRLIDYADVARPRAFIRIPEAGPVPDDLLNYLDHQGCLPVVTLPRRESARESGAFDAYSDIDPAIAVGPDDLAYISFTSGSTGKPKGVMGRHGSLSHFIPWLKENFGLNESDRFSMASGLSHDPLHRDIFTPLQIGAAICIPDQADIETTGRLARWMKKSEVTITHLTPAMGQVLTESALAGNEIRLESLRLAFFVGDVLTRRDVRRLQKIAPNLTCVNYYGTTETQRAVSYFVVGNSERVSNPSIAARLEKEILPLGKGIRDVELLVMNGSGELAGIGELGEVFLRSPHVALGYLNNEELTRERFLLNTFTEDAGDLLYKTGDLGRYLPDGNVEALGRADCQVKIRGFRVELGEIEAALGNHPSVRESIVIAREDVPGDKRLVAYVVAASDHQTTASQLRSFLKERFPDYMVPSAFVFLETLPLTPNGKADRKALPPPATIQQGDANAYTAPRTPVEEKLGEIWSQILKVCAVDVNRNFFDLGGHSLLATQLAARIVEAFHLEIPLRVIFSSPTVAELAAFIESEVAKQDAPAITLPTIEPRAEEKHAPFPLNDIQQAYWIGRIAAIELGDVASHRYIEFDSDNLDLERFNVAWQRLIDRHDMLRAVILPDGQQQILETVPQYRIATTDLRGLEAGVVGSRLDGIRKRMSHQILQVDQWPLFDICASLLDDGKIRLHFSFDFLIADAWSFRILIGELCELYADPSAQLPHLDLSFRDYVLAESELQNMPQYQRSKEYWWSRLKQLPPAPDLPLARSPGSLAHPKFVRRSSGLDRDAWSKLKTRAAQSGLTPSNILLAAFAETLAAWNKSPRFTLVLTLFNRFQFHPQVNELVGDFTSTNLLAIDSSAETFQERALAIRDQLLEDMDHRYVSGVKVIREMARTRAGGLRATMPVVFTSTLTLNGASREINRSAIQGEVVFGVSQTPQVWLDHQVFEQDGALSFNWDAVEEIFPEGLLDDMFESYRALLDRLINDAESWKRASRQMLPAAQLEFRAEVNATSAPRPSQMLHTLFSEQAQERPDQAAVISGDRALSYDDLERESNKVARWLLEHGARPNSLVAVVMKKGWEQVVAVYGILKSGAAYLPISAGLPKERLWYLLEDGQVDLILTQPWLDDILEWPARAERLAIEASCLAGVDDGAIKPIQKPEDLAYVIYTSGSTGLPKGVMIDHTGAVNTILDINERFGVAARDRVLAISSLSFDLSVYDVFGLLAAGGTIVLPDASGLRDPSHWLDMIKRHEVTIWNSVPALVDMLVRYVDGRDEMLPDCLRVVMMSGDWIPVTLPDQIKSLTRDCRVYSLGGATEASIWSIYFPIETPDPDWKSIPYGKPLANQTFNVLNEALEPCPVWVPGQLYIGGIGLAKGYWRNKEKTDASFIHHPIGGERLYRTGDLGRYLPDGNIEFLGREDFQVKIQGYRIELGEIEAALLEHTAVKAAVVTAIGDPRGNKRLVAYVVAREPEQADAIELRGFLNDKLPEYMVPSTFLMLDALPLTSNGKVDRQSLPLPNAVAFKQDSPDASPKTETEQTLADIWSELLCIDEVGVQDNFFEVGGDSVLATQLVTRVRARFGVELAFRDFFLSPTIADLADTLEQAILARTDATRIDRMLDLLESIGDEEASNLLGLV